MVKNLLANAGDVRDAGLIPESGRSLGEGHGLENPKDREAWRATVHRVTKSRAQLKQRSTHACRVMITNSGSRVQ